MTAPHGFPAVDRVEDAHQSRPEPEFPVSAEAFRTVRIKVYGTDRVLQLGTMIGAPEFKLDGRNACEFPSYPVATVVLNELTRRLNAGSRAMNLPPTWTLIAAEEVHETTESWRAMHRFDRTALETAYLLAASLPSWVRRTVKP